MKNKGLIKKEKDMLCYLPGLSFPPWHREAGTAFIRRGDNGYTETVSLAQVHKSRSYIQ